MRVTLHPDVEERHLRNARRELSVLISDVSGASHQMSRIRDAGVTGAMWFVSHETVILRFSGPSQSCMDRDWPIWRDMGETEQIGRISRAAEMADAILSLGDAEGGTLDPVMISAAVLLHGDPVHEHLLLPTPWSGGAIWNATTDLVRPVPPAMTQGVEPCVELHVDMLGTRVRISMTYGKHPVPDMGMDQRLRIIGATPTEILRIAEKAMRTPTAP